MKSVLRITLLVAGLAGVLSSPLVLAKNGADDPAGDNRGIDVGSHKRQGADDPAGDLRRGRHGDDGLRILRNGADDPAGDLRHGRRGDDLVNTRNGADNPPGDMRHGQGRDDRLPRGR